MQLISRGICNNKELHTSFPYLADGSILYNNLYSNNCYEKRENPGRVFDSVEMINVLMAEDHPIVRDILSRLLEKEDDLEIVAMVRNGEKAVNAAILHHPHVAVLDIRMPDMDGIEATKEILEQSPETRVLMLSGFNNEEYIHKSLEAGALGYILKDFARNDLVLAIHAVYEGHYYFSEQIAKVAKLYMTGGGVDEGSAG